MAESSIDYEPVGYIYHLSSKQPIGPAGGKLSPKNGTELVVYDNKDDKKVLQFRFVRVEEFGHFGYIEHCGSNKIVHATKDNKLVLSEEKNVNAVFIFDLESYIIMHRSGKYWHVKGNDPTPDNGTPCLLQKHEASEVGSTHINDSAKFYFGKFDAHHEYPYSKAPSVSHHWKLLQAFIAPKTNRSFEITYKVGRVKESSKTVTHAWKISAEVAYSFLKSSIGYDGSIASAEASTLTKEKSVTLKIDVPKDCTVCVWQYVYCITEFGDEIAFLSDIICDTDSIHEKPDIRKKPDMK